MKERIFFDNNATTKISDEVLKVMMTVYAEPLNPSSIHYFGRMATRSANQARENVRKLLSAQNYEVIFTSGGTESNNLALFGFRNYQIVTSAIEHPSVYNAALQKNGQIVAVDENCVIDLIDLEAKIKSLNTRDFIVSVMLANNETGAIQPVKEIAKLVHQYGGLMHSDIVQATSKININLEDLNIDMASISSHKLHGPQGAGALLVRKGLDIEPIIFGSSQEGGKRPGTLNVAGSTGLGEACRLAVTKIEKYEELANLRNYLEENLQKLAGDDITIFSKNVARLPNTCYFATKNIDNQTQMINLDLNGIAVSIGAACSSGSSKPSRVLSAMGFGDNIAKSAIRVSLGLENTKQQVDRFLEVWKELYEKTRN
ncbi:MAG: cysteine desulfurase [Rickettsiaceae bacterium]|jgi:cysteine desulfurase|nr:cysteine desulfurase [Rickettsiaceae bacterium]